MAQYNTPPGGGLEPLIRELKDIHTQLRDLQRPSGTNIGSLVAQVQTALINLSAQVQAEISANSYTKAVIDSKVANPPAGSAVTGNVSATGTASIGGLLSADAGINSLDARNRVLTSSYGSVYADGTGRLGQSPSARRFKQDIVPATVNPQAVYAAELVTFRYKKAVLELGGQAPVELGAIAEQFDECGLGAFVVRSPDGAIDGIAYEKLTVALIATVQSLNTRVAALEAGPTA